MLNSLFKRFSGSHYRKFYRKCQPIVARINEIEVGYQSFTEEQLRAQTEALRQRFKAGESLDALLPEAFAAVKNAARRLCGRDVMVMGHAIRWEMVHYDVQLIGGIALHQRMIAEMATGEGKTLVATLPLYLNALSGRNCQLVTVNEYLAHRDAQWMGHLFQLLGLTVGVIRNMQPSAEKRAMYGCDITYGTASEFGFDYLRDNGMATRKEDQVQRDHFFTIVDEADSILIDEARTPLIISGPAQVEREAPYPEYRPMVEKLVNHQARLCNRLISEAKEALEAEGSGRKPSQDDPDPMEKVWQVKQGNPKNKQLMRLLEDGQIRKRFDQFDLDMNSDYNKGRRYALKEELFFTIEEKQHTADLTEIGRNLLRPNDNEAFVLPDLATLYVEIDRDSGLDPVGKEKSKLAAQEKFERASEEIHVISQLLRAYSLYERDIEYVVQEGKVMIVDENTGRVMPGRRWSDGLHQAIEAKEGVAIEKETKTYATITIQNYFRLYEKLSGMTGTAETEANEFRDIYKLTVMVIPTHKPCVREDRNDLIYKTRREKYNAVIDEIRDAHQRGQPVLVGTTSVESSEVLSRMLKRHAIVHTVLNAKFHQQEAEIVSRAGHRGAVTIATNMAGRGTDIKLSPGVPEAGGLYVIGTERHTSRRIDRQLRGRCARQGDPGISRFYLSLEDDLMRLYGTGFAGKMLESSFEEGHPLEHSWLNPAIERAQKTVEQHHYSIRKRLLQYDDVLNRQREVIYGIRNQAIQSESPKDLIFELIDEEIEFRLEEFGLAGRESGADERERFYGWASTHFPIALGAEVARNGPTDPAAVKQLVLDRIAEAYRVKESVEDPAALRHLERYIIIGSVDQHWQNHLTEMEDLRQSVGLRSYGQRDPLSEYKSEAFSFFETMMNTVRASIGSSVFRSTTHLGALQQMLARMHQASRTSGPEGTVSAVRPGGSGRAPGPGAGSPGGTVSAGSGYGPAGAGGTMSGSSGSSPGSITLPKVEAAPKPHLPKPGRNDDCPCGSGKKYKKCCFPKYG